MIFIKKLQIINDYQFPIDIHSTRTEDTKLQVKIGEKVQVGDCLANVYRSLHMVKIRLQEELGIKEPVSKLHAYIDVLEGQVVEEGKVLAHKSFLGTESFIKAPFDGIVHITDEGIIELRSVPVEQSFTSLLEGVVVKVDNQMIIVQTAVAKSFGVYAIGPIILSKLRFLTKQEELDITCAHTVVFIPFSLTTDILEACIAMEVSGIVCVSIDQQLLDMQIPISILVLEGFGAITTSVYDRLKYSDGLAVYLDTEKYELTAATSLQIEDLKQAYVKDIVFNDMVQLYNEEEYFMAGRIKSDEPGVMIEVKKDDGTYIAMNKANILGILQ